MYLLLHLFQTYCIVAAFLYSNVDLYCGSCTKGELLSEYFTGALGRFSLENLENKAVLSFAWFYWYTFSETSKAINLCLR